MRAMCNTYVHRGDVFVWASAHEKLLGEQLVLPAGAAEGASNIDLTWKEQLFPDDRAPIVIRTAEGRHRAAFARWGLPSSKQQLFKAAGDQADTLRAKGEDVGFPELLMVEPDAGTTSIRDTDDRHWTPYLGVENRCLVPLTGFAEPDEVGGSLENVWFALANDQPLAYGAGVHTLDHGFVRKVRTSWEIYDLYAFITTDANGEVGAVHEAMPVIFTTPDEIETWLTTPWREARTLQRPLPNGMLKVVGRGRKPEFGAA